MQTPHASRGLTVTFSWDAGTRSAVLRLAIVLALCAGSYAAGRRQGRLDAEPTSPKWIADLADAGFRPKPAPEAEKVVVTPLNMRDPTALVMGPGGSDNPPAPPPASVPGKRIKELKISR
jgi:hypothetical protein